MRSVAPCLLLVLALGGTSQAAPLEIYRATAEPFFTSSVNPANALDDGAFALTNTQPSLATSLLLGYFVLGTGPASFDIRLDFFDQLTPAAAAGMPVNTLSLGGITIPITNANAGVNSTGFINLTALSGGGILFPDNDWSVQVRFLQSGSETVLSTLGTPLFAGGPLAAGQNNDQYWRDVNANGLFEASESRQFGGPPNKAQFYLIIRKETVPEPASLMLLAAGAVFCRFRRGLRSKTA